MSWTYESMESIPNYIREAMYLRARDNLNKKAATTIQKHWRRYAQSVLGSGITFADLILEHYNNFVLSILYDRDNITIHELSNYDDPVVGKDATNNIVSIVLEKEDANTFITFNKVDTSAWINNERVSSWIFNLPERSCDGDENFSDMFIYFRTNDGTYLIENNTGEDIIKEFYDSIHCPILELKYEADEVSTEYYIRPLLEFIEDTH